MSSCEHITDSHFARLSRNALHGAGLRLSTGVSRRWPIRGPCDADGFLRFENPQDDAGFGSAWPDHFFAGSSAVSVAVPVAPVATMAPVALVLDNLKSALQLLGCMAQRMKNTP